MARMKPEVAPPRRVHQYRIRFIGRSMLSEGQILTAKPGVIKNDRPRADRVLASFRKSAPHHESWMETRWGYDGEWKKVEDA